MDANKIPTNPVNSSNISEVGYDEKSSTLVIVFIRGGKYSYAGVPLIEFEGLQQAASVGGYFHKYIKDNYKATKV